MISQRSVLALVVVALAAHQASAAEMFNLNISDRCQTYLGGMVQEAKLNECFPIASIVSLAQNVKSLDMNYLNPVFKSVCSIKPCNQSLIDSYGDKIIQECYTDLQALPNVKALVADTLKLYTPLQKSMCYLDQDSQFCAAKNIAKFNSLNASVQTMVENANSTDFCTPCNQHIIGTNLEYLSKAVDASTPNANNTMQDVVSFVSTKCGADFANKLATSTNAPFPDVQAKAKLGGASSDAATSSSISALAVILAAGVASTIQ